MLLLLGRVLAWTLVTGGVMFALGFIGPMLLTPDANQAPLAGIFVTGPLGLVAGFVTGLTRELLGYTATPVEWLHSRQINWKAVRRILAAILGFAFAFHAVRAIPDGVNRPVAGSLVVAVALFWYAAVGRLPWWFRR